MPTCPICVCAPCVCDADESPHAALGEPQEIAFTARALRPMLYANERALRNVEGSSMGPHCDLARCLRDAIHQATGGEPDLARAALYDAAPALLRACEDAAEWLEEVATGLAPHRSVLSALIGGLTQQAATLRCAAAKARPQ